MPLVKEEDATILGWLALVFPSGTGSRVSGVDMLLSEGMLLW